MADYRYEEYFDGTFVPVCLTEANTFWTATFFVTSISVFFFLPLFILIVLYSIIAKHLMSNPGIVAPNANTAAIRYRRQVVAMLATVVLSFFICLLPFRALTLWIIVTPPELVMNLGVEKYYNLLYFCRIMFHFNSAVNPILYNLMSTKFRDGFRNICCFQMHKFHKRRRSRVLGRKSTFTTTTLTNTSSSQKSKSSSSDSYLLKKSVVKMISFDDSCSASIVVEDSLTTKIRKFSTSRIALNRLQESYV